MTLALNRAGPAPAAGSAPARSFNKMGPKGKACHPLPRLHPAPLPVDAGLRHDGWPLASDIRVTMSKVCGFGLFQTHDPICGQAMDSTDPMDVDAPPGSVSASAASASASGGTAGRVYKNYVTSSQLAPSIQFGYLSVQNLGLPPPFAAARGTLRVCGPVTQA